MAQVRHHVESRQRQYGLQDRALRLGWLSEKIEVVDDDQGISGASTKERSGFQRLVSDVAMGEVGAVFGLEVSRLARSCADWYRLLEVASLAGTLIVDEEGVYDPNHYNDRLLLGLKGTLSEAELHFLKSRMIGGRRNKARRAAFRIRLPAGYVWQEGETRMDPDERVRDTIHLFFKSFERLGSAARVARFFEESRQPFPRRDGWGSPGVAVTWGPLSVSRAVNTLHSPIYAGIYAYARESPRQEDPEDPGAGGRILISGSHPGYITEDQFKANQIRLFENRSLYGWMQRRGSPREGSSLLQGIVLCGRCGRHLLVRYPTVDRVSYVCRSSRTNRLCQEVHGRDVEPLIERVVLESVSREELELAVGALEKLAERSRELDRQWQKRIEAARYEASRAARRYHQVEPENRLVARTLEREWNELLEEVERLENKYEEMRQRPPLEITNEQRQKILELANDLPRLFREPTTQNSQRKQIVRLLIEDVTLRNVDVPWGIEVAVRWRTGMVTRYTAKRPERHPWTTRPEAVERIEQLLAEKDDEEIAEILNAEGHRSGYRHEFTAGRVASLRLRRGLSRLRRTSSEVIERIESLTPEHTDVEIATLLNQEGKLTASGRRFTDSIVRHIRHRQRKLEQCSERPEEDEKA
jgi:DNA invertase Pin-like site-specific DNA recombinase